MTAYESGRFWPGIWLTVRGVAVVFGGMLRVLPVETFDRWEADVDIWRRARFGGES